MNYGIKVTCNKYNLKEIRDFVYGTLKQVSIEKSDSDMIVLAVDEICSNLIIHSNQNNEEEFIELNIKIKHEPEGIVFEIIDSGDAFNYSTYEEPSLSEIIHQKRKGGMGMMLVRRIMDSIEFKSENTYNVCRLFKRLNLKAA